jgi:hypothetical protein
MVDGEPAWQREPLVRQVADALLDRREAGPLVRARPVRLKLDERTVRGLFAGHATDADYQWSLLERMQQEGWIALHVDPPRRGQQATAGYYRNPKAELVDEVALRRLTGRDRPSPSEQWRNELLAEIALQLGDEEHAAVSLLARRNLGLDVYPPGEVARSLLRVRELDAEMLSLREVSGLLFWGHSKVLDEQQDLVAALLGLSECPFPQSPIHLNVWLPARSFSALLNFEWVTRHED